MPRHTKIEVEWRSEDAMWLVAGGKLEEPIVVATVELKQRFPLFVKAAEEFLKTQTLALTEDDLESLVGCAASSMAEIVPARQRFAVYRAVAMLLGYKERSQLPDMLEDGIKQTWSGPDESFIGYKEG